MKRSGRRLTSWKRSFTQARAPKPPARRTPWSGPSAASGRFEYRIAQTPTIPPPTIHPAAKPITAPVRPATAASDGQSTRTATGAETVSHAYASNRSRARGIAGTIHHARANGRADIRAMAIPGLNSRIAPWRSKA